MVVCRVEVAHDGGAEHVRAVAALDPARHPLLPAPHPLWKRAGGLSTSCEVWARRRDGLPACVGEAA